LDAEGPETAGIRVVTIADAGHVMMDDQPAAFTAALAAAFAD
jgi:pimeloyl-ACP methyl ester carboxylesterase